MQSQALELDATDWRILELLQADARLAYAEIGRRVSLSATAVAERMRRMEDAGIITGYTVRLDYERLGLSITAFIRLTLEGDTITPAAMTAFARGLPEIQELYSTIGTDCYLFKVVVRSVSHLDDLLNRLRPYGRTATSIVLAPLITGQVLGQQRDDPRRD
jgi:Lrp/AsnC family leucine-responsive transcriptional regulator